jgi:hypothetical protein
MSTVPRISLAISGRRLVIELGSDLAETVRNGRSGLVEAAKVSPVVQSLGP